MPSTLALARSTHVRTSPERSGPTLVEESMDASVEEIKDEDDNTRKQTFLGVPIPTYPTTVQGWSEALRRGRERIPTYLPRRIWLRTLKSTILVTKVISFLLSVLWYRCSPCLRYSRFRVCARRANPGPSLRAPLLLLRSWTLGSTTYRRHSRSVPHMSRCSPFFVRASGDVFEGWVTGQPYSSLIWILTT